MHFICIDEIVTSNAFSWGFQSAHLVHGNDKTESETKYGVPEKVQLATNPVIIRKTKVRNLVWNQSRNSATASSWLIFDRISSNEIIKTGRLTWTNFTSILKELDQRKDVNKTMSWRGAEESEWVARKSELSGIFGSVGTKTVVLDTS